MTHTTVAPFRKTIIQSLLDTDFYKLTMMQIAYHQFNEAVVEYRFKCRTKGIDLIPFIDAINKAIVDYCQLTFTKDELAFLKDTGLFKETFLAFLAQYQPNASYVTVQPSGVDAEIDIIVRGPWVQTILFEVPVLAIVNEIYFQNLCPNPDYEEGQKRLQAKIDLIKMNTVRPKTFAISDFGTRRRFSREWQDHVVSELVAQIPQHLKGTSNVFLAKKYGLLALGTMAHEFLQAMQVLGNNLAQFQTFALEAWAQEYRGKLGIALSDVMGFNAFLREFDLYFCKLYDGMRHDSDDPFVWGEKAIQHYLNNGVSPQNKVLLFSDSLTIPLCLALHKQFSDRSIPQYGVGTNLTHDLGYKPLSIVMKMTMCNGQPVAKISDAAGKTMCEDEAYLNYLRKIYAITPEQQRAGE